MRKYISQKLTFEFNELKSIWDILVRDWKQKGEDYENLFRFRIPLRSVAFICRSLMESDYIASRERNNESPYQELRVRILRDKNNGETFYKNIELMQYSDTFRNRGEMSESLYEVCNYIIHELGSSYADDMVSYKKNGLQKIKSVEDVTFYYCVYTHNLRKRFNKGKQISYFVQYADENNGEVLIDINSLLQSFENFITEYNRVDKNM